MLLIEIVILFVGIIEISLGSFQVAPGKLLISIISFGPVSDCYSFDDQCTFQMDICFGTGTSWSEKCLWYGTKKYSGKISTSLDPSPQIAFPVDNINAMIYMNANATVKSQSNSVTEVNYLDQPIQFMGTEATTFDAYSKDFVQMTLKLDVACSQGFYPAYQCTRPCFSKAEVYDCDQNGNKICYKGYLFSKEDNNCIKDQCSFLTSFCKNNGTCINKKTTISCKCDDFHSGIDCGIWNPCKKHRCQNKANCQALKDKYLCHCQDGYVGQFCEIKIKPCEKIFCKSGFKCQLSMDGSKGKCVSILSDSINDKFKKSSESKYNQISASSSNNNITTKNSNIYETVTEKDLSTTVDDINSINIINRKESHRMIQSPFQNAYTILAVIMVILVFVIGIFVVSYWILKIKYFHKNKTYHQAFSTLPPLPPMINMPSYHNLGGNENFRRWHSVDDSSLFIYNTGNTGNNGTFYPSSFVDSTLPRGSFNQWRCYDNKSIVASRLNAANTDSTWLSFSQPNFNHPHHQNIVEFPELNTIPLNNTNKMVYD